MEIDLLVRYYLLTTAPSIALLILYIVNENEKMELEYLRKEVVAAKTKAAEVRRFSYTLGGGRGRRSRGGRF